MCSYLKLQQMRAQIQHSYTLFLSTFQSDFILWHYIYIYIYIYKWTYDMFYVHGLGSCF